MNIQLISAACYDNKHEFMINVDTGQTDIDNHPNTHLFGNNVCPLKCKNKTCSVDTFIGEYYATKYI